MRISDWSSDVCSSDLHRVAESEGNAPRLGRGDHHLSLLEGHGDRNLQQRVLPGGDRLQCEGRMALARRGNDDDVDLRVGQRLLEVDRPMAVAVALGERARRLRTRSEEHTSELQSLMRISYAVFCLKKQTRTHTHQTSTKT